MFFQRDYILRIIEQLGQLLIALRDRILRREVSRDEVRNQIRTLAEQAGLDLEVARKLDPASLLMWLSPTGEADPPRFWLMAELLYLEALHAHEAGRHAEARPDLERALALYSRIPADWKPSPGFASAGDRTIEIERLLEPTRY